MVVGIAGDLAAYDEYFPTYATAATWFDGT
jgi:hypothetical protein